MMNGADMAHAAKAAHLTEREQEVAGLLHDGLTNGEIAEHLGISFTTAKWHVSQVLAKLGAERREDVGPRLAALATDKVARGERPRMWAFGWFGLAKGLGLATMALPVAVLSVAGVVALQNGADEPDGASTMVAEATADATIGAPVLHAGGPKPQAHTCDWEYGQQHMNDGPLNHSGCDFSGVDFGSVMWNDANLSGANLSGAVFKGATLYGADLSEANVRGTWFIGSVMAPNFNGADLTGAHFTDSIVGGTYLGATCPDGSTTDTFDYSCIGRPGMENRPDTRSMNDGLALRGLPARWTSFADAKNPEAQINLDDFLGQRVVLWWFAGWCERCQDQTATRQSLVERFPETVFIGLSLDETPDLAMEFANAHGIEVAIGMDSQFEAAQAYQVIGAGIAVTIAPDGRIESYELLQR